MAVSGSFGTVVDVHLNRFSRENFENVKAGQAMELLKKQIF